MDYVLTASISFSLGVVLTLIFRIRAENALQDELDKLKASAENQLKKL